MWRCCTRSSPGHRVERFHPGRRRISRRSATRWHVSTGMLGQFSRFLAPPAALQGGLVLGTLVRDAAGVLGHAARRAQVTVELEAPDGDRVQAPDASLLRFLVLRSVLRGVDRIAPGGKLRLSVGRDGGRPALSVEGGDGGRELAPGALEEGLEALARTQLAELHVTWPRLRLVLTAA